MTHKENKSYHNSFCNQSLDFFLNFIENTGQSRLRESSNEFSRFNKSYQ